MLPLINVCVVSPLQYSAPRPGHTVSPFRELSSRMNNESVCRSFEDLEILISFSLPDPNNEDENLIISQELL